jgi:hypothetical protein
VFGGLLVPVAVTLVVVDGPAEQQKYVYEERSTCLVGRSSECGIHIPADEPDAMLISRHLYGAGELERLLEKLDTQPRMTPEVDTVREAWSDVCKHVRDRSRTVHVILSGAAVHDVEGNRIVLVHTSAALAKRLADPRNAKVITDALDAVFGVEFEISCIHQPHSDNGGSAPQRFDAPGKNPVSQVNSTLTVNDVRSRWPENTRTSPSSQPHCRSHADKDCSLLRPGQSRHPYS